MHRYFTHFGKIAWITVVLICTYSGAAFAQLTPFIEPVAEQELQSSPELDEYETRIRKNPNVTAFHFVRLNPLKNAQRNGVLKIDIPGQARLITAEVSHVEYHDDSNYEWIGKTDEGRGTIVLIAKSGRISAHISTPAGIYEISSAPNGLYCVQEIDTVKASSVGCATDADDKAGIRPHAELAPPSTEFPIDHNAKMNACQPLVNPRVLVLYTPKALMLAGSVAEIQAIADMSVSQFNSCIYNSGITSNAVLTLAGIAPLNNLPETQSITNDLNSLENNLTAQNLRNQYQADLVVLFTDAVYQGGDTRGKAQTVNLENSKSYAIVELWTATSRKTFAHEVGHLYGCRHEDTPGSPAERYCHCWWKIDYCIHRPHSLLLENDTLKNGSYLMRLTIGDRIFVKRIIVQK